MVKKKKKYKVVAKVGNKEVGNQGFVKYNVNNLRLFASFLDKKFPDWRYFNVYSWTKDSTGNQIGSFTKNKRPTSGHI